MDRNIITVPKLQNACEVCRQQPATRRVIISQPIDGKTKEERCACCERCLAGFEKVAAKGDYSGLQVRRVTESEFIYHPSGTRN